LHSTHWLSSITNRRGRHHDPDPHPKIYQR
jgi:hypothetical protein